MAEPYTYDSIQAGDTERPNDQPVTVRVVSGFEEFQMAVAIRAVVYMGEMEGNYAKHFDANDHCATHLIVFVGDEPVGTIRCRWFAEFARLEKLALRPEYRNFRVLRALGVEALRLCQRKGYRTVSGVAFPRLLGFWKRYGGLRGGRPFHVEGFGDVIPISGDPPPLDDREPVRSDDIGTEAFERRALTWEGALL